MRRLPYAATHALGLYSRLGLMLQSRGNHPHRFKDREESKRRSAHRGSPKGRTGVRIVVRGDSGFCREELMAWCEAEGVDYLLGLAKNERLKAEIGKEMGEAKAQYQETGRAARLFKELLYQTRKSWSRARRVVAKAEHVENGESPRFVVTSVSREARPAQALYEELYCGRGDMENRIKEQLMLFSDRTSPNYLRS